MSAARTRLLTVYRGEASSLLRRPMLWVLLVVLVLVSFGLSNGNLSISSGDTQVGGTKAWVNSEFAVGTTFTFLVFLLYTFFIAVSSGMTIIRDDELQIGEVLHSTPLRPGELIWGKFLAHLTVFCCILLFQVLCTVFFFQFFPIANAAEIRGPFLLRAYLRPAFFLALPTIVFFLGTALAVGERSRRPIVVFALPVALLLGSGFFLWSWSPSWLSPAVNKLLMVLDPAGFRWITETWLKVDRGVEFYNTQPIGFDSVFYLNRLLFVGIGLLAVVAAHRHYAATLQGDAGPSRFSRAFRRWLPGRVRDFFTGGDEKVAGRPETTFGDSFEIRPLGVLGMKVAIPGMVRSLVDVARVELRELRSQPGIYLFAPLILLQVLGTSLSAIGPFQTPLLLTSGTIAQGAMNTLSLLVCLLLLFYTVESLERERATGFDSIYYATPVRTAAILFGKAIANSVVGAVILTAAFVGSAIAVAVQGRTPLELSPFVLLWGLLLVPTFLAWSAFVGALLAMTRSRYSTYGLALAALIATGWFQLRGEMNWVFNWNLWSTVRWSDMGPLELNRTALILNRVLVVSLSLLFTAIAVRGFGRRERDASGILHRLQPARLARGGLRLLPFALLPLVTGSVLGYQVRHGFQGALAEKAQKDYWRKNIATYRDAVFPAIEHFDLDLDLEPADGWFRVDGSYVFRNHLEEPMREIVLTGSPTWRDLSWTVDGEKYEPEDRAGLFVVRPEPALAPGDTVEVGFRHEGNHPQGITRNGGGMSQFILESGVVLHAFDPTFVPLPGFQEGIGIDEDNAYDSRVYPEDHYKGLVESGFGSPTPFTTRIQVEIPEEYRVNSVGTLRHESVADGRRTVVWESDHPVKLFNVVAGKWEVAEGEGTKVFYHPAHDYNIEEITRALEGARRYYSEWFHPFPWNELKISEFPNQASYAQGFPTNITFSEGIGFLAKSDPRSNIAFMVTAHEAAHQWWGNMLTPGRGPGGNILSEGMSHFATLMLTEQMLGQRDLIELLRRLEERYGDNRQVDSERPMVKIDGTRAGDTTVMYDKGGWVAWMLMDLMGREAMLDGLHEFLAEFMPGPDHPLLEDLFITLRRHAPDVVAFDEFVEQWVFDVVVPEYRLRDVDLDQVLAGPGGWRVRAYVENVGEGRMPVEVAVSRGERFTEDGDPSPDYSEARSEVTLAAGEGRMVEILADFEPERILVDPDARVLQLQREVAVHRF